MQQKYLPCSSEYLFKTLTLSFTCDILGAQGMVEEEEEEDEPEMGMQGSVSMYNAAGGEDMEDDGMENGEEDMHVNGS